ncbi:DUF3990 domain-containing protein [Lentibacillus sp. N15]|uniref:DUF3990 domain-containing protein n=1 Tax=Lentibacillus songyuanensis TaxID=3136161 RepID=UPI0031BBACFA
MPTQKGGVDFGPGFYLTTNFNQAKEWAMRRTTKPIPNKSALDLFNITIRDFLAMKKEFQPVVLQFEIKDILKWEQLNCKVFEYDNDNWKHLVWNMRQDNGHLSQPVQRNFDWIMVPWLMEG